MNGFYSIGSLIPLAFIALVMTTPAKAELVAGPIHVTGLGSWEWDNDWPNEDGECFYDVYASGTDGTHTASFSVQGLFRHCPLSSTGTAFYYYGVYPGLDTNGAATIDGISAPPNLFTFNLANGVGSLEIYDVQRNRLATAQIIGYSSVTSATYLYNQNGQLGAAYGRIAISPVPEPESVVTLGIGLIACLFNL